MCLCDGRKYRLDKSPRVIDGSAGLSMIAQSAGAFGSWVESSDRRYPPLPKSSADRRIYLGMLVLLGVLLILTQYVQPHTEILWAATLEDPNTDDDRTTLLDTDDFDQAGGSTTPTCLNSIKLPRASETLCPRLNFAELIARGPPVPPSDTSLQNLRFQYDSQSGCCSNGHSPLHDLTVFARVPAIKLCGKQDPGKFYGAQDLRRTEDIGPTAQLDKSRHDHVDRWTLEGEMHSSFDRPRNAVPRALPNATIRSLQDSVRAERGFRI